ncbi:MAG: HD domain-containing protein [Candidatus Eisenbacteria bacterium]|nr:HD domain-containing protein [Candidatus Eisenbacteria bacterium]
MEDLVHSFEATLPEGARRTAEALLRAGGRACAVGGSLRDHLLGLEVKDWDFATDLLPERVRSLFPRAVEVGIRFGTILVMETDGTYEVTTFRRDGRYSDARHPDSVSFTASLEEDLSRRDFTINAMAFDLHERRLIDPQAGRADLGRRIIRCVGRAEERFREDALRMLRAVRIAGQLGFEIEEETYLAIVRCAALIDAIAMERVREELDRILTQPMPSISIGRLLETGLLERFLPELADAYGVCQNRYHAFDIYHHSLCVTDQAPAKNKIVRLAALLHDLGKVATRHEAAGRVTFYNHQVVGARMADQILRRLRYSGEERERVVHLVEQHMFHYNSDWTDAAVRRFVRAVGPELMEDLFAVRAADTLGNGLKRGGVSGHLLELRSRIAEIRARDEALSVRDLQIDGHDLMSALGIAEGPLIGRILDALLDEVLEDPARNAHDALLGRAAELRGEIEPTLPPRRKRKE